MPKVSTDDASRRLEFVWLGQVENPWIIQARVKLWGIAAGLTAFLTAGLTTLGSMVGPVFVVFLVACPVSAVVAILATWRLSKHLTAVTPLGYHASVFASELNSPRLPPTQEVTTTLPSGLFLETRPENHQLMSITAPSVGGDPMEDQ